MKMKEIEKRYNNANKDYPDEETMSNDIYFLLSRIHTLEEGIKLIDRECSLCQPYKTLPDRVQKMTKKLLEGVEG